MGILKDLKEIVLNSNTHQSENNIINHEIDRFLSSKWPKTDEKKPGILDPKHETPYKFKYETEKGIVEVDTEYEFPYMEIKMKNRGLVLTDKIKPQEFIKKEKKNYEIKHKQLLHQKLNELAKKITK